MELEHVFLLAALLDRLTLYLLMAALVFFVWRMLIPELPNANIQTWKVVVFILLTFTLSLYLLKNPLYKRLSPYVFDLPSTPIGHQTEPPKGTPVDVQTNSSTNEEPTSTGISNFQQPDADEN